MSVYTRRYNFCIIIAQNDKLPFYNTFVRAGLLELDCSYASLNRFLLTKQNKRVPLCYPDCLQLDSNPVHFTTFHGNRAFARCFYIGQNAPFSNSVEFRKFFLPKHKQINTVNLFNGWTGEHRATHT